MDYYNILGIDKNASQDDIKKAYRKKAGIHHPDKGGDENEFKKVQEAYETLSDPNKKASYDQPPFTFNFNFDDFFNPIIKNSNVHITVELLLSEVLTGKELLIDIHLPNNRSRTVDIKIPPGIESGDKINFHQLGDNSIPQVKPGDLIVSINVIEHKDFERLYDNLVVEKNISAFDAMLGTKLKIKTLEEKVLEVNIPPATQHGTILSCNGHGLPNKHTLKRGNLYIKVNIVIPELEYNEKQLIQWLSQKYQLT